MTIGQIDLLGLIAAVLQVAGYVVYIRNFRKNAIKPNAASFLMFAYGTSLLAFLEWKSGADWALLALPFACAGLGVVVGLMCLRKGATEPIDWFEARAFWTDIWLTVFYMFFAFGLGDATRFVVPFLIATNLSAIVCFVPILRSTFQSPERELPLPWVIWTAAYLLLTLVTVMANGFVNPVLLLYPMLNAALHMAMVALCLRKPVTYLVYRLSQSALYIADSSIEGLGLFSRRDFVANDTICQLRGAVKKRPHRSLPNWIGIGPGHWIDPAMPLQHINHSCTPNVAFGRNRKLHAIRDIASGEELTLDYSTTEADPEWAMSCVCQSPQCRRGIFAIQISFADADYPPQASPLMQLIWRNRRISPSSNPAFPQLVDLPAKESVPAE
jgi:uncharacterized protein